MSRIPAENEEDEDRPVSEDEFNEHVNETYSEHKKIIRETIQAFLDLKKEIETASQEILEAVMRVEKTNVKNEVERRFEPWSRKLDEGIANYSSLLQKMDRKSAGSSVCGLCFKECGNESNLQTHMAAAHPQLQPERKEDRTVLKRSLGLRGE